MRDKAGSEFAAMEGGRKEEKVKDRRASEG